MGLSSFFTKEETIAGLEISDSHIRISFFDHHKKGGASTPDFYQEEHKLPEHAIEQGVIQDSAAVTKTITSLLKPLSGDIRYAIVTIPSQCAYIKTITFPKSIQGKKLNEAMDLAINFQLPIHTEDVYLDWEPAEDRSKNEVVLIAAQKSLIDGYIAALSAAKISPVAIEPHIFAVLRSTALPREEHTLIVEESSAGDVLFWIAHEGMVRFVRSLPKRFSSRKEAEMRSISAAYEAERGVTPTVMALEHATMRKDIGARANKKPESPWLASIGAASRGAVPRAQDSLTSLMPMGTMEAYRQQRLAAFIEFIANATIGIAIFFSIAFAGTWLLMSSLQQRALLQIENLNALPISADTGALEARAKMLNELAGAAHQSLQQIPRWSAVIDELRKRTPQGITVTNATFPSPEGMLAVTGTAGTREQLTVFKRSIEESDLFTEIALPATNLEVREMIPFSLSFKLKDPAAAYIQ